MWLMVVGIDAYVWLIILGCYIWLLYLVVMLVNAFFITYELKMRMNLNRANGVCASYVSYSSTCAIINHNAQ